MTYYQTNKTTGENKMADRKVTDTFYKYEKGRYGLKYDDGHILELNVLIPLTRVICIE